MDMWARVSARFALRLDLELVRGVSGLQGTDIGQVQRTLPYISA
jgi:hypothetical protein